MKRHGILCLLIVGTVIFVMVFFSGAEIVRATDGPKIGLPQESRILEIIQTTHSFTETRSTQINEARISSINAEIGSDFRLSSMGSDGNASYDALVPAVAYNSANNQYLVVWSGSDDIIGEFEIWGQRVNAATGAQIGADFQISFVGITDDPDFDALDPDVAYNSTNNEYLVVWESDHYADGDYEIFGRRVNAATGALLSSMVRISVMGPGVDPNFDGLDPAVAYNSADNQYLVIWEGDDDTAPVVNGEFEIWGRFLDANAERLPGDDQFRLSDMGGLGNADYDAYNPDVAYNSTYNEFMAVWHGDDSSSSYTEGEYEIWGQRLNASGGAMGASDFRISDIGPDNDPLFDASSPSIAYNNFNNQYIVVWHGDTIVDGEMDIFGQRLEANGIGVGANDFYISNPGTGPNSHYDAVNPTVAFDQANRQYMVVWQDDILGVSEFEIWSQRIDASSGQSIDGDTRLSDMGPDGDASFIAQTPAIAYSGMSNNQFQIVWSGDNTTDGEFEIWSQRFSNGFHIYLPLTIK